MVIATPVSTHYEFARRAMENGKHVLVEKPLTSSVAEAEKLLALAGKHKLTLMVDHTFIYTGAVRKMKEIIDNEETWVMSTISTQFALILVCSNAT